MNLLATNEEESYYDLKEKIIDDLAAISNKYFNRQSNKYLTAKVINILSLH